MAEPITDEEKGLRTQTQPAVESVSSETRQEKTSTPSSSSSSSSSTTGNIFTRLNDRIISLKYLEKRGIERVPVEERHAVTAADYMQMTLLWFSTNITANNMAVGMLGPLVFSLGFVDSALCAVFGAVLGAAGAAYMGTFGPESGNRTMVRNSACRRVLVRHL